MVLFKVTEILDGQTIKVSPSYKWTTPDGIEITGEKVRISGYKIPWRKPGYNYIMQRLEELLKGKMVVLKNAKNVIDDPNTSIIACNVFINNVDVSYYFPEFRHK